MEVLVNKKIKLFLIFSLFTIVLFTLSTNCFAADPKIVTTVKKAFEQIKDWIIKIATPAAAVAVGTGENSVLETKRK